MQPRENAQLLLDKQEVIELWLEGKAIPKVSLETVEHYKKLAENDQDENNYSAKFMLGVMYEAGLIKEEKNNPKGAQYWFELSAQQLFVAALSSDDPGAGYLLAICYEKGLGVEKDLALAKKHYVYAAERGHAKSIIKAKQMKASSPLLEQMEINTELLAIRYKDYISSEQKKTTELDGLNKAMLLSYGLNYSSKGTGLFIDAYLREANLERPSILRLIGQQRVTSLFVYVASLLKKEFGFSCLPINGFSKQMLLEFYKGKKQEKKLEFFEREIKGKKLLFFRVNDENKQEVDEFRVNLSITGAFLSKHGLSWIVANLGDIKEIFINLFCEMNPSITPNLFNQHIKNIVYKPLKIGFLDIRTDIVKLLGELLYLNIDESQRFYFLLLKKLITNIEISKKQSDFLENSAMSLSRINYLLMQARKNINNRIIFFTYIEFCFDEISYLASLNNLYNKKNINDILLNFVKNTFAIDSDEVFPQIVLGDSGMNVLSNAIMSSLGELDLGALRGQKIYLQTNCYFEMICLLEKCSGRKLESSFFSKEGVVIDFSRADRADLKFFNDDVILDLMVCAFQESISSIKNKGHNDIVEVIKRQFHLRKLTKHDTRLIVVIDTTASRLDDIKIKAMLLIFQEQIKQGKLAILMCHSLNKYFNVGLDKFPGGLGVNFYNEKFFPIISKNYKESRLAINEDNPDVQMLTHLVKNVSDDILKFNDIVLFNSQYIHRELAPLCLFGDNKLISIDNPFAISFYEDMIGFVVIRISGNHKYEGIERQLQFEMSSFLTVFNINNRDSYGFHTTTHLPIPSEDAEIIYRLSVGFESKKQLKKMFVPLFECFQDISDMVDLGLNSNEDKDESYALAFGLMVEYMKNVVENMKQVSIEKEEDRRRPLTVEERIDNFVMQQVYKKIKISNSAIDEAKDKVLATVGSVISKDAIFALAKHYQKGIGYEFCLMSDDIKPEQGKLYFRKKNNHIAYTVITPSGEIARDIELITLQVPEPFTLDKLNNFKRQILEIILKAGHIKGIQEKNIERAISWYLEAAKRGHVQALYCLGECCEKGEGVKKDLSKAVEFYKLAADKQHSMAQYRLGLFYEEKSAVANTAKAESYFLKAAKRGNEDAQYQLYLFHKEKNPKLALEYLHQAGDRNHPQAQFYLGQHYSQTTGYDYDADEAKKWYKLAKKNGHVEAAEALKKLNPASRWLFKSKKSS